MAQLRPRCIGILREVKNKWERRTPLTPSDVSVFTSAGVRVLVQPSTLRIFTDSEFAAAGATITDDLSPANTILGVKEFPASSLLPNRSYLIFSHTIKAQPANMAFLDECRRQRVRLFDYETIRSRDGKRLVAFGQYAGIAGMIDGLRGVGERLLSKGYSSPFMGVGSAYMYPSIDSAKRAVEYCGEEIRRVGLPKPLLPFRVVFTGAGNVTQGAQSVFEALPHQYVDPAALPSVKPDPHTLYAAKVSAEHMVQHAQGQPFNKAQYYDNPSEYVPVFHERVAPHTSLLVNGMYWDNRYPRLITLEQYRRLQQSNAPLLAVADITCDVKGSVEMLQKSTTIEQPFFVYDGVTGEMSDRVEGDGVLMLGVDNLPAEFPRDASTHFSSKLKPFIEALASNDNDVPLNDNVALPPELLNACITSEGELTANFAYIDKLRQANTIAAAHEPHLVASTTAVATAQSTTITPVSVKLLLSGHLLDTQFINTAFDVLEDRAADFRVLFFDVSPNRSTRRDNHSHCVIEAHFDSAQRMEDAIEAVQALAAVMNKAEAKITRLNVEQGGASTFSNTATDGRPKQSSTRGHFGSVAVTSAAFSKPTAAATIASRAFSSASRPALRVPYSQPSSAPSAASSSSASSTYVAGSSRPHIVVLGSGFVAAPMVEWLAKQGYPVTVASNALADAQRITQSFDNCTAVTLDASDTAATSSLIASSAITVSLLPHTMHVPIARLCLQHSKHLLTASYVSPAMRALHDEAASRGLVFMNELGLDPGIDHMSAMETIERLRGEGEKVVGFESVCGGLPAPDCADNPFQYKFSWSPAGMLGACIREARWREAGQWRQAVGSEVLQQARPFMSTSAMQLEVYPNHDSRPYETLYGLDGVHDMYRGTLRYSGTSELLLGCIEIGLLGREELGSLSGGWRGLLARLVGDGDVERGMRKRMAAAGLDSRRQQRTIDALQWLGALSASTPLSASASSSAFDQFCSLLSSRLTFKPDERDMVVLIHRFTTHSLYAHQERSELTSTLLVYGEDEGYSAMGRTVGLPAAMGVDLIAQGGVKGRGVVVPVSKDVYEPIMRQLAKEGLRFQEERKMLS